MEDSQPPLKQLDNRINLGGIIVAIVLVLLSSKWLVTVFGVSVLFVCSALLLWHLPWVEAYAGRRILLTAALGVLCVVFGYYTWPNPEREAQKPAPPELHGLLIPASQQSPAITCGGTSVAPYDVLNVVIGPLAVLTNKTHTSIKVGDEEVLSVTKAKGGIKISARVVSASNQVIAVLSDNELYVNPGDRFKMQRVDWHSLTIEDSHEKDRDKAKVLDVYFLNASFVRVYGVFHVPGGGPFIAGNEISYIGQNVYTGGGPPSYCILATNAIPKSTADLGGGVTVVVE